MPESKTSSRKMIAAERKLKAFEMRKAGASYTQIAKTLNVTPQASHKAVMSHLKSVQLKTNELVEDVRTIELLRLDSLLLGIWKEAALGSSEKIDRVLKIMTRRADLLGLDSSQKIDISTHEDALEALRKK